MSDPVSSSSKLVLRHVRDQSEAERWAAFNGKYNNPHEGEICACLVRHHPYMPFENFWLVEDADSNEIVSTTCLIPWRARFCGVELKVAQLEMVLTHPAFRGRGLVRRQIENFHHLVRSGGYDLSIIWGIPFYYRQFGYTYTLSGQAYEALTPWQIPDPGENTLPLAVQPATTAEIPALINLHKIGNDLSDFHILRDEVGWNYMLLHARHPYELIYNSDNGLLVGYACTIRNAHRVTVFDSSIPDPAAAQAYLAWLKPQALQGVNIYGPVQNTLSQAAHRLGSSRRDENQWLVRITDLQALFLRLAPVFNARLQAAGYRNLCTHLIINVYTQAFRLNFTDNWLSKVEPLGFVDYSMGADGGDLCIPLDAFTRLFTGYRSLDQLRDAWPDINVKPLAQQLVDVLFPKLSADLYTPYQPFA